MFTTEFMYERESVHFFMISTSSYFFFFCHLYFISYFVCALWTIHHTPPHTNTKRFQKEANIVSRIKISDTRMAKIKSIRLHVTGLFFCMLFHHFWLFFYFGSANSHSTMGKMARLNSNDIHIYFFSLIILLLLSSLWSGLKNRREIKKFIIEKVKPLSDPTNHWLVILILVKCLLPLRWITL